MKCLLLFCLLSSAPVLAQNASSDIVFVESSMTRAEVKKLEGELTSDLVQEPLIKADLKKILGAELDTFIANTAASTPAVFVQNQFLLAGGCLKGNCAGNDSFFVINADDAEAVLVRFQKDGINRFLMSPAWKKLPATKAQELANLYDEQ